jgi:hypothetical protein
MLQSFIKNKNIYKKLKLVLKNIIIDKTLTYASDTSTLTKRDRKQLNIFEREVYRRFIGPVYDNEKIIGGYKLIKKFMHLLQNPP